MTNCLKKYFFSLFILSKLLFLSFNSYSSWQDKYLYSIVNIDVTYSNPSYVQPWQKLSPKIRSGQAIAISENELLAISSLLYNYDFIEVQTAFQTKRIQAKVKIIDYDTNLCILEVDKSELTKPFKPLPILKNVDFEKAVTLLWLTKDNKFIKTNGKIEYPDVNIFSKIKCAYLVYNISSESSPEGYSEAVIQNDQLLGLVESFDINKKNSTIITFHDIKNFLIRASKKKYLSVPKFGFNISKLNDIHTRKFFKLHDNETRGVYVTEVFDVGTGSSELLQNDIILKIENYDIDPLGNIYHKDYGKLPFWYLISEKEVNDKINLLIWRKSSEHKLEILCKTFSSKDILVPYFSYDSNPQYIIIAGFVFQELTWDYILEYGENWETRLDPLLYFNMTNNSYKKIPNKNRIIFLNQVLPHGNNQGYQHLSNQILKTINGENIKDIQNLYELIIKAQKNEFIVLSLDGFNIDIVIPTSKIKETDNEIKKIYKIDSLSNIE